MATLVLRKYIRPFAEQSSLPSWRFVRTGFHERIGPVQFSCNPRLAGPLPMTQTWQLRSPSGSHDSS
jgi:hypothetical protein